MYTDIKYIVFFSEDLFTFFLNYNLTPLDMCNGLSKYYYTKPEKRIN